MRLPRSRPSGSWRSFNVVGKLSCLGHGSECLVNLKQEAAFQVNVGARAGCVAVLAVETLFRGKA